MNVVNELWASSVVAAAVASALTDSAARTPAEALTIDDERGALLRTVPELESALASLWDDRSAVGSALVSVLSQGAAAAAGTTRAWSDLSDDAMRAQGEASALVAKLIVSRIAPAYGFLRSDSEARVLDVGTGVGAIATALAEAVPSAVITGIDIDSHPLAIAESRLGELGGVGGRVRLRHQDVLDLEEIGAYDLAWLPVPFIPDPIIDQALTKVITALRPGGLLVLGTISGAQDRRLRTANAWLAAVAGGSTLTTDDVIDRVNQRGFLRLKLFETVPGGPILVAAIRPSSDADAA
ncbi:class I SAM-dependent methyltransferase [Microbacterium sp. SA39]|uniref:class I SAM-dependent methyltransferase n=1 Tax=Microbacterium sp. SA39 TaxID=1263625 RepID=UPI000697CD37|nr:class I SAM-dependent methyltransferase [Microbacterium sp. SA39]